TKRGAGTLVFAADNAYAGDTTIEAGTLQLGNGGTSGNLSSLSVVNDGELAFNRSNDFTVQANISGSGALRQFGSGITTLSGTNTYAGGTQISAGTLRGTAASFGSGVIQNMAALQIAQDTAGTLGNVISGSGTLTKSG